MDDYHTHYDYAPEGHGHWDLSSRIEDVAMYHAGDIEEAHKRIASLESTVDRLLDQVQTLENRYRTHESLTDHIHPDEYPDE